MDKLASSATTGAKTSEHDFSSEHSSSENMYLLAGDRYLAPMMVELCPIRGFLHFWWRYLVSKCKVGNMFMDNLSLIQLG